MNFQKEFILLREGGVRGGRGSYAVGLHGMAGGYMFRRFLAFSSGGFLSVVFRVPQDVFLAFGCLLGSPGGSPGRHFW